MLFLDARGVALGQLYPNSRIFSSAGSLIIIAWATRRRILFNARPGFKGFLYEGLFLIWWMVHIRSSFNGRWRIYCLGRPFLSIIYQRLKAAIIGLWDVHCFEACVQRPILCNVLVEEPDIGKTLSLITKRCILRLQYWRIKYNMYFNFWNVT